MTEMDVQSDSLPWVESSIRETSRMRLGFVRSPTWQNLTQTSCKELTNERQWEVKYISEKIFNLRAELPAATGTDATGTGLLPLEISLRSLFTVSSHSSTDIQETTSQPQIDIAGIVIPALLGLDTFIIISFTVFIIIMAKRNYERNKEVNKKKKKKKVDSNAKRAELKRKKIVSKINATSVKPGIKTQKINVKPAAKKEHIKKH